MCGISVVVSAEFTRGGSAMLLASKRIFGSMVQSIVALPSPPLLPCPAKLPGWEEGFGGQAASRDPLEAIKGSI